MSATTATTTQPALNRVVKGDYQGYIARVLKQGPTGDYHCQLKKVGNPFAKTDWISPKDMKPMVKLKPGTMCFVTGGILEGFFAQVEEHDPENDFYVGSAHCITISPGTGSQRRGTVEDKFLKPCTDFNVKFGKYKAKATMTPLGLLFDIQGEGVVPTQYQSRKFTSDKKEVEKILADWVDELENPTPTSLVDETSTGHQSKLEPEPEVEEETLLPVQEDDIPPTSEESVPEPQPEPEPETKKSNLIQFPSRSSVIEIEVEAPPEEVVEEAETEKNPPETVSGETDSGAEEEDWTYLSSEAESRADAIANDLVKITEPFVKSVTDFLWELKFVVFENDHRRKSRTFGTFEQMCRHLYDNRGFPYHPNTAREKANAEQERRLLRQAGVKVEVERMSDTAALELRKVDALAAEPEVILEAKRQVVENAPDLTKKGITSSIKSISESAHWEDTYKFRYPSPKKRQSGEKAEPISRQEVEEIQSRNARLRQENESLQFELAEVKDKLAEKSQREAFLSGMVKTAQEQLDEKERELEQLKQELEEMRQLAKMAG